MSHEMKPGCAGLEEEGLIKTHGCDGEFKVCLYTIKFFFPLKK